MSGFSGLWAVLIFSAFLCAVSGGSDVDSDALITTHLAETLWTFVNRATRSSLSSSLTDIQSQLDNVRQTLDEAATNANSTNAALASLNAQLNDILARQGASEGRDTDLEAKLQQLNATITNQMTNLHSQLPSTPPRDCSDLPAGSPSGVYLVRPGLGKPVPAYCDQSTDGGGWTVVQRRADITPREDFYRGWQEYKWGFGTLDGEFWWGLENMWLVTTPLDRRYELRIDLEDFDGEKRHAVYQGFRITSESDGYRLTAANYTGDAEEGLTGRAGSPFTTKDKDQDTWGKNCAVEFKGAWWYTKCHSSNLNGLYLSGEHSTYANGVNWAAWKGHHYSLKNTYMKIRPTLKLAN